MARHPDQALSNWYLNSQGDRGNFKVSVNGEEFTVKMEYAYIDDSLSVHSLIVLMEDDRITRIIDCGSPSPLEPLITAWTFENGLILQTIHDGVFDVWWDGEFLNEREGGQSSLGFQILDGKPFYFFQRDDKMWLSYDGEEVLLPYDEIETSYCCMRYPIPSPRHYEDMITYFAIENGQEIFGVIGFLSDTR